MIATMLFFENRPVKSLTVSTETVLSKIEISSGGANIISDNVLEASEKGKIGLKDYAD